MSKKRTRMVIMRAKRNFATTIDGRLCTVVEGELADADHEIVQHCPDQFEAAEDRVRFTVEQATSNPGEHRGAEEGKS